MTDAYVLKTKRLAFPALFTATTITPDYGERPKFRISAILTKAEADALPDWLKPFIKEAKWRNAPSGQCVVNLSSLFRVPVFGLPEDFLKGCEVTNQEPDRVLAMFAPPGEIMVMRSQGSGKEFVNLIAVRVDYEASRLRVPVFEEFPALLGAM